MVGKDPCDSTSLEFPEEVALPSAESLDGIRFGVPPELTGEGIEDGVKAVFEQTLAKIEDLGGKLEEVGLPHSPHGIAAYYVIAPAEASAPTSRATTACASVLARRTATCSRCTRRRAQPASAPR